MTVFMRHSKHLPFHIIEEENQGTERKQTHMNIKINENFNNLAQNYLFSEIGKRVKAYTERKGHPIFLQSFTSDVIKQQHKGQKYQEIQLPHKLI